MFGSLRKNSTSGRTRGGARRANPAAWWGGLSFSAMLLTASGVSAEAPANNVCAGAEDISSAASAPLHLMPDTSMASPGDPFPLFQEYGLNPLAQLWYTFTAPGPGILRCIESSDNHGFIGAYPNCESFVTSGLGINDHDLLSGGSSDMKIAFAQAGDALKLAVTTGLFEPPIVQFYDLTFTWESKAVPAAPSNDACVNAVDLNAVSFPYSEVVDNWSATDDEGLPCTHPTDPNVPAGPYRGVWYTFTAPSDGWLEISETSAEEVGMAITTGCGDALICNDGSFGRLEYEKFVLQAGQTIKVLIGCVSTTPPIAPIELGFNFIADTDCQNAPVLNTPSTVFGDMSAQLPTALPVDTCATGNPWETQPDIYYAINITAPGIYAMVLTPDDFGLDARYSLTLLDGCGGSSIACTVRPRDDGVNPGPIVRLQRMLDPGMYYLRVSVRNLGAGSFINKTFTLDVFESEPEPGELCTSSITIPLDTLVSEVLSGTTDGSGACGQKAAWASTWHTVTIPTAGAYEIYTSRAKSVVYSSCGGAELACGANQTNSESLNQSVELTPGTYFIRLYQTANWLSLSNQNLNATLRIVSPACPADFNGVNGVTVQDIFDFLTAWLAGNSSADFNGVNGVTVQDIFDFLTAWLAGC